MTETSSPDDLFRRYRKEVKYATVKAWRMSKGSVEYDDIHSLALEGLMVSFGHMPGTECFFNKLTIDSPMRYVQHALDLWTKGRVDRIMKARRAVKRQVDILSLDAWPDTEDPLDSWLSDGHAQTALDAAEEGDTDRKYPMLTMGIYGYSINQLIDLTGITKSKIQTRRDAEAKRLIGDQPS